MPELQRRAGFRVSIGLIAAAWRSRVPPTGSLARDLEQAAEGVRESHLARRPAPDADKLRARHQHAEAARSRRRDRACPVTAPAIVNA